MKAALAGALGVTSLLGVLALAPAVAGGPGAGEVLSLQSVPLEYAAAIAAASAACDGVPAPVLASQLEVESGWRADAVSPAGAQGLAQFMPSTWARYGVDGNGDGRRDPFDPLDAIWSAAGYDCVLKALLRPVPGDPVELVLAGYNAGPYAVLAARGVPAIRETQEYVRKVISGAARFTVQTPAGAEGLTPAAARVRALVIEHFGVTNIGGFARDGHVNGSDHYTGRAVDVMLTPLGSENTALGWRIATYLQSNARQLQIKYLIWQGRIWSLSRAREGWRPYRHPSGSNNPTLAHMDHVHVSVF